MLLREDYDVLVIGSGLAGITASLVAASRGCRTCLVTDGSLFVGSSFSASTWGLGMVTESHDENLRASESLFKALDDIGMGMNDPKLGSTLVSRADDALAFLQGLGATLLESSNPSQREFVACFDHVVRTWHGFVGRESQAALIVALVSAGVVVHLHARVLSLLRDGDGAVSGALALVPEKTPSTLHKIVFPYEITAKATILATGGVCGLYGHHLCSDHCQGIGHVQAIDAGASLLNMEFQQLMLGTTSPIAGIIYNEKLYRWTTFTNREGIDAFSEHGIDQKTAAQALEAHSWHGPYTTRLASRLVDETLDDPGLAGHYRVHYDASVLGTDAPEFVQTYFTWMRDERGLDPHEAAEVAMFAHSSNGGIKIDEQAQTDVFGLFACGECAGGVHGADRIGGLASVTAATYGMIAGEQAAELSGKRSRPASLEPCSELLAGTAHPEIKGLIGETLDHSCMVNRTGEGLLGAQRALQGLSDALREHATVISYEALSGASDETLHALSETMDDSFRVKAAHAVVTACLRRTESRGPHHRSDFPELDPRQSRPLVLGKDNLLR